MKRTVPTFIASLVGLVMILSYFVPVMESWGDTATTWFNILAAAAVVLGSANLIKLQLQEIFAQKPGWAYAAITVLGFMVTLIVGLGKVGTSPQPDMPYRVWSGDYVQEGSALWWLFQYVLNPITATMFGMLAFYVASAAFRAFRAKNLEATLLLVTAVIVLLGNTYAGAMLTSQLPESLAFLHLPFVKELIQDIFNTAGNRAITIGIALGLVAISLKILLGLERPYLGGDAE